MKYKSLKTEKEKVLHIPLPNNGMEMSKTVSTKNEGILKLCSNAELKNGRITTRKGLKSYIDNVLDVSEYSNAWSYNYVMTDTVFYIDEVPFNIAYVDITLNSNNRYYRTFLIGEEGYAMVLGDINFSKTDTTTYFVPSSVSFYTGTPQNGGGIFALVAMSNIYNSSQTQSVLYEIDDSLENWVEVTNYYIPTVYINGKGNRYEFAKQAGQAHDKSPASLEKLNILNGKFYAYYSSDGYSSSFKLPFANIADSLVTCRIYTTADSYTEWKVNAGSTKATATFFSATVTMNLSREKGIFYFTVEAGTFEVPLMSQYKANNIRILAETSTTDDFYSIATAKSMATSNGNIYFAGGKQKNKIYYTSYENPLYFPQINDNSIGASDIEITALSAQNDKIIAFKPLSVHSINVKRGKALNENSILNDNGKFFYDTDTFDIKSISRQCGNIYQKTVAFVGSSCVWFDGEKVRLLKVGSSEIYDLTEKISPLCENLSDKEKEEAFGFAENNNYFLLLGSKAVIINFDKSGLAGDLEGIKVTIWQMPSDISLLGAAKTHALTVFLCLNKTDGICYTAYIDGDSDIIIRKENGILKEIPNEIETLIEFSGISFGNMSSKRRIKGISFKISAEGDSNVKLLCGSTEKEFTLLKNALSGKNENTVKLITDIYGAEILELEFKSLKSISLGECDIYYIEY